MTIVQSNAQTRAAAYSAKCDRRRNRKVSRRKKFMDTLALFGLSLLSGMVSAVIMVVVAL